MLLLAGWLLALPPGAAAGDPEPADPAQDAALLEQLDLLLEWELLVDWELLHQWDPVGNRALPDAAPSSEPEPPRGQDR